MENDKKNTQKTTGFGNKKKTQDFNLGRVPPQARQLEEAVLGALMLDKDAVAVVVDILRPDSFYVDAHKEIYKAICELFTKSHPIDLLTVAEQLKSMGLLDVVGGPYYLVELTNRVASSANVEYHARIIAQKYIQRELIRVSTETIHEAYEDTTDVFDLLDKAENNLFGITELNLSRGYMGMSTLVNMAVKQLEELAGKEDGLTGIPSGFVALDRLTSGWQRSDLIIMAARPGMGKCLGKDTPVILFDGTVKKVQEIVVGDLLMGPDSKPRRVLSIATGQEQMYWIRQNKGMDYRVNGSHILSLKRSRNEGKHQKGTILNISVNEYLQQSNKFKSNYKGYKTAIEFEAQQVHIEPYFLGLWLGDGSSKNVAVTAIQPAIVEYLYQTAAQYKINVRKHIRTKNSSETYHLVGNNRWAGNSLRDLFIQYNLLNNKHIPQPYLANSSQKRLELLAGLIDSDGHYQAGFKCYEITQKNEALARQIKFLCDTLGFRTKLSEKRASIKATGFECTVYRLRIFGDLDKIPVRLHYKQAEPRLAKADWQVTGITVEKDIVDDYYGFELDGDGLFLLEDCTVTHNTSLTLALARNAAVEFGKGVAFFSLEMANLQLVNRIIAMETEIPSENLRKGRLQDYEWQQLHAQIEKLGNTPIYIDDTPGISVFELRAKCRRMKMQHDIQLIIIDYLQLMTVGNNDAKGNREQEISTISRSLKGLAKELNVPIIALSQLSRAVETRGGSKRPQLSDLRECVTGDTRVLLQDGRLLPIRDLVGKTPLVWALSNNTQKLQQGETDLVWKVGKKPVFEITLASGRRIKATAEHRLLGFEGWSTVAQMKEGDRIGILRFVPQPAQTIEIAEERLIVLAHLIGDGSYIKGKPLRYTTGSELHSKIVSEAAIKGFGVVVNRHDDKGNWHQLVFSGNGNRWQPKGINAWFRELGIFGQRSFQKHLPDCIFQLSNKQTALFLRHLWATDGTIFVPKTNNSSARIAFATNSRQLAEDVAFLLLRFGIVARIRSVAQGEKYRTMYSVEVSGMTDQLVFLDQIGAVGEKEISALALREYLANKNANTNVDTLPIEVFERVKSLLRQKQMSQRLMASLRGTSYGGSSHFQFAPSRAVVAEYADILQDETLKTWAESDVFWDKIVKITPLGEEDVFDLTVLEHHNWVANGIISHNSGAIEQDADIVAFIYRPEYYQILEDEEGRSLKGIGELIIAKHRNGALDTVRLKWDGQFAKFSNLEDEGFGDVDGSAFFNESPDQLPPQGHTFSSKMNSNNNSNRGNFDDVPF